MEALLLRTMQFSLQEPHFISEIAFQLLTPKSHSIEMVKNKHKQKHEHKFTEQKLKINAKQTLKQTNMKGVYATTLGFSSFPTNSTFTISDPTTELINSASYNFYPKPTSSLIGAGMEMLNFLLIYTLINIYCFYLLLLIFFINIYCVYLFFSLLFIIFF